jgi:dolichol-phosphate mannosyltransferase
MTRISKVFIILPAYNEETALTQLIPCIAENMDRVGRSYDIVVVNDGSSDKTSSLLASLQPRYPIIEVRHDSNRGYGRSIKTGLEWCHAHAGTDDAVVTLDADNTHDPVYIPKLIDQLESGFDGATASYSIAGGSASGVPLARRLMSRSLNFLLKMVRPIPHVITYTNGYRAYTLSILRKVRDIYGDHFIDETGFPGGTEFFLKCVASGGVMTEIPFHLHYENRGTSKIRIGQTIARYLKLVFMAYQLS